MVPVVIGDGLVCPECGAAWPRVLVGVRSLAREFGEGEQFQYVLSEIPEWWRDSDGPARFWHCRGCFNAGPVA